MTQQFLGLRRSAQVIRRRKLLVMGVAGVGLILGVAYGATNPPRVSSQALVVLPVGGAGVATQVVIVSSDAVLSAALPSVHPSVSLQTLRDNVQAASLTANVISITAQGKTDSQAETTANAVANSYINYVGEVNSPVGHIQARLLEPAVTATGSSLIKQYLLVGLLGALAGALIGMIVSLAIGRNDRKLIERDEIANSIGVPVVASLPVEHPTDAPGWTRLLDGYDPDPMTAWRLRRGLQLLGLPRPNDTQSTLSILTLASDPRALAIGPQLAVAAARLGITTSLVIGPQQNVTIAAALRAACAVPALRPTSRPRKLTTIVSDDGDIEPPLNTGLTVLVTVVDPVNPKVPYAIRGTTTVIGGSAGKLTAEQMARVAMAAAAHGQEVVGILVADPDSTDRTTGRAPALTRPARRSLPSRTAGIPTESRR